MLTFVNHFLICGAEKVDVNMPYTRQTSLLHMKRSFAAVLVTCACISFAAPVAAQDKSASKISASKVQTVPTSKLTQPSEGLRHNLPIAQDFATQSGLQLDLPIDAIGAPRFQLDLASSGCSANGEGCLKSEETVELGVSDTFRRHSDKGLDLTLTPRASIRFDNEISSTAVGAKIEIGEDLREGSEFKSNTWYFFAGADAGTLTYSPNSVDQITSGELLLRDRILVGDAEAGLGYRIGDADVSLSYKRREATNNEIKFKEDAAALSFTWKR